MTTRPASPFTIVAAVLLLASTAPAQAPDAMRVAEIATYVGADTYGATPGIEHRDFWRRVGQSRLYRSEIRSAEQITEQPFTSLPDELYLEYSKVGNRSRYEKVFFAKLDAFRSLVVAECIEDRGRFIEAIQQAISSYAAEKTWVLPAHDSGNENFEGRQITIDLFASEVACELANADHILGTRLSDAARSLVRAEIKRRILDPYTRMVTTGKPGMWWLTGTNNWNAVCLANVTGTALALLEQPRDKAFYIATAEKYIGYFLTGFTDDGYCSEGIGYWNYGYGCFVRLGHMLDGVTAGKVNLFALAKAKNAGLFARRMEITPGQYPAFADCPVGSEPSRNIMSYVTRRYQLPPTTWELSGYSAVRWLDEFGVFSFAFQQRTGETPVFESAKHDWFDDAGILICRGAQTPAGVPVGVALKGGHNAEHHNHNDVGSYVYCVGDEMTLVDPGSEVYTRRTFSGQRYESGVLNSLGHPVPRVAGRLQRTGRSAAATDLTLDVTDSVDTYEMDLTSAYSVPSLKQLRRTFVFSRGEATLTVTDSVKFDAPQQFGTAIITFDTWHKLDEFRLRVGNGKTAVIVQIDSAGMPVKIDATTIDENVRGGKKPTRVGIDLAEPVREATVKLTIAPAGGA